MKRKDRGRSVLQASEISKGQGKKSSDSVLCFLFLYRGIPLGLKCTGPVTVNEVMLSLLFEKQLLLGILLEVGQL